MAIAGCRACFPCHGRCKSCLSGAISGVTDHWTRSYVCIAQAMQITAVVDGARFDWSSPRLPGFTYLQLKLRLRLSGIYIDGQLCRRCGNESEQICTASRRSTAESAAAGGQDVEKITNRMLLPRYSPQGKTCSMCAGYNCRNFVTSVWKVFVEVEGLGPRASLTPRTRGRKGHEAVEVSVGCNATAAFVAEPI